jgi:pimeloyl-ACP methyl ester carboxylesterase
MRRLINIVLLCGAMAVGVATANADSKVGVVLLHGKTGMPGQMAKLSGALTSAGYLVATPEMCWSKKRIFDKPLADCLAEIDTAITRLKAKGAVTVVVGGTSQGGVAVLDYAAMHDDLLGVIALAPAADPLDPSKYPDLARGLQTVRELVAAGKGDVVVDLPDLASGKTIKVHATPNAYLSFHGSDSPIGTLQGMQAAVLPRITVPLLWVAGSSDPTQKIAPQAFASVPKNARSRLVNVAADHGGTPDAAADAVLDWLKTLQ